MTIPPPFPDAEQVVIDILDPVLAPAGTWLDPDFEVPRIQVNRIGGGPDEWGITDYPQIRIRWYDETRNKAWDLAQAGQMLLLAHAQKAVDRPGKSSHGILVDYVELDVGGTEEPDLDPDDRRVTTNWTLGLRRQYHLVGG